MKFPKILFIEQITDSPDEIDRRLKKPLSLGEFAGLSLALIFPLAVMLISPVELGGQQAYDFQHYLNSAKGDFSFYYYAYWLIPIWQLLNTLPLWLAYLLWTSLNTIAIFFASRMFGSRAELVLLTYQTIVIAYMGQFTGMILAGLAILWWSLSHGHFFLAGVGIVLAASKYHTGLIPVLTLLVCFETEWNNRLKSLVIPAIVVITSLVIYPLWPLDVLATYQSNPANDWGSVALWQWIGPVALFFWIPPFVLKMTRKERILAIFATLPLGIPYFQQVDLLILTILPIGFLPALGNLGFFKPIIGYLSDNALVIIPLSVYMLLIFPKIIKQITNR